MKNSIATLTLILLCAFASAQVQHITVDDKSEGRIFEGLGALSAGASSRLLIDYPEPYRSQILDILFKPGFAASLQHFKVEIGGDINSTSGAEPSHARTKDELLNPKLSYYERGYEFWLMQEAKKRNPEIFLDALEWGAPGWIGNGVYYSKDNIDYIIGYIKGLSRFHQISLDYIGVWNERMYDIKWIKDLRKALDTAQLQNVKIVAADLCCGNQWKIADDMVKDKELLKSVAVIGDHYPEKEKAYNSSDNAKALGVPLWNNEGGPWKGDWDGFKYLAKMFNRDYIEGRMTKNITWSLITSYYDNLALPNSGMMKANTPWSGFYEIEPALWAFAHTTQFAKPGWKYLNNSSGYLEKGGSYVTLISQNKNNQDVSLIIETIDAEEDQPILVTLPFNVSSDSLQVWQSKVNVKEFVNVSSIEINNKNVKLNLEPGSLYSLTTTTGQQKGGFTIIPERKPFPFPYTDNFNTSSPGKSPKYFSDQGGAFEVVSDNKKNGNFLQQKVKQPGIEWEGEKTYLETVLGDSTWSNYRVRCNVMLTNDSTSYISLLGRATELHRAHKEPEAYVFKMFSNGSWELKAGSKVIKEGIYKGKIKEWNIVELEMNNDTVSASINNNKLCQVKDNTYTHGLAGIGSS
ncbi:MAG TPA: hypothetical protein VFQ86_13415, partial [Arachidicoccus soli]|nr:hypothetical protein [Arachidicoccus soli]